LVFHRPVGNDKVNKNNLTIFTKKSRGFFHKNFAHFAIALKEQNPITFSPLLYFVSIQHMNQLVLLTADDLSHRTSRLGNIKATFIQEAQDQFDVILEINSNKFLIKMQNIADQIQQFEIIAIKWFIELSNSIILMIKRVVEHLRYRAA